MNKQFSLSLGICQTLPRQSYLYTAQTSSYTEDVAHKKKIKTFYRCLAPINFP